MLVAVVVVRDGIFNLRCCFCCFLSPLFQTAPVCCCYFAITTAIKILSSIADADTADPEILMQNCCR